MRPQHPCRTNAQLRIERLENRALLSADSLDPTFGINGVVQTDFGTRSSDQAATSMLQPDGKILVAGVSQGMFAVARYNASGALDPSFSSDGKALVSPPANLIAPTVRAMALQSDGKIVLVGSVTEPGFRTRNQNVAVVRLHRDGQLDTSFSDDGFQFVELGTRQDEGWAVLVQPDGKIVVAANYGPISRGHLIRFLRNGALDTRFSGDGISAMATNGSFIKDIALQPDGRILAGGWVQSGPAQNFMLTRFLPNGALDGSFGQRAKVVTRSPIGVVDQIHLLPDGSFYVAGSRMIVNRYFADGQLDTSFTTPGQLPMLPGEYGDRPMPGANLAMAVRPDGGFALLGLVDIFFNTLTSKSYFVQLNADGNPDESFSGDGQWNTWTDQVGKIELNNILQRPDGRMILTGYTSGANDLDFIMFGLDEPQRPSAVTAALAINSQGQIELFDREGHDDRWQFARTSTDIVITDLSPDPRFKFTVNDLPQVSGSGTKQLRIPLSLLQANGLPLIVNGRDGDDDFTFESDLFDAPVAGISFRGGSGQNILSLASYTIPASWILTGPNAGTVIPQGRVPMSFSAVALLRGSQSDDNFRLLYQGSDQTLAVDAGLGGLDTVELSADEDMGLQYFSWPQSLDRLRVGSSAPQYYSVQNFERAVITGGASDNQLYLPGLGSIRTIVYAGSGNDIVSVGGPAIIFGEDGDDQLSGIGILRGGNGNDIIISDYDADQLYGDAGRDILIGGFYTDLMVGGSDDDILIGGKCSAMDIAESRDAIFQTWTSSLDYATRVNYLSVRGVGPGRSVKLILDSTVTNDLWFLDTFYGNEGQDWFWLSPDIELNVVSGGLRDQELGEQINNG